MSRTLGFCRVPHHRSALLGDLAGSSPLSNATVTGGQRSWFAARPLARVKANPFNRKARHISSPLIVCEARLGRHTAPQSVQAHVESKAPSHAFALAPVRHPGRLRSIVRYNSVFDLALRDQVGDAGTQAHRQSFAAWIAASSASISFSTSRRRTGAPCSSSWNPNWSAASNRPRPMVPC